jgi:hypothetical protein
VFNESSQFKDSLSLNRSDGTTVRCVILSAQLSLHFKNRLQMEKRTLELGDYILEVFMRSESEILRCLIIVINLIQMQKKRKDKKLNRQRKCHGIIE